MPTIPGLYCAPATIDLAGAEIELVPLVAREARLSRAFAGYDASGLDYILIDCPPSLGLLTVNALVAAAEVLIPIQCEYYALEGLEQLLRTIDLVKGHLNPELSVSTILLTMYDGRTRLASQVAEEVREHFGESCSAAVIPRSVRVSEAPSYGQSVMTYDPGSSGPRPTWKRRGRWRTRTCHRPSDPVTAASGGFGSPDSRPRCAGRGGCGRNRAGHVVRQSVARPPPWQDISNRILGDAQGDAVAQQKRGLGKGLGALIPSATQRSAGDHGGTGTALADQQAQGRRGGMPTRRPGRPAPGGAGARGLLRGDRDRRGHPESPPAQADVR